MTFKTASRRANQIRLLAGLGFSLAAVSPVAIAASEDSSAAVVDVTGGQIRGARLTSEAGAVFKGIPFAQPPVGALRWREPQLVKPWNGIRDALKSGPPAAQPSQGWNDAFAAASSEDCLYLDVWTPELKAGARLPVMVWIHGGANVAGAGGFDALYDGRVLIRRGVVLVVVEYRLGIFGFFSHPELTRESPHHASGNQGLMDQIAALRWVRDNIATFGGDPDNVTLFGQSAGAIDIMALMTSPRSAGLFRRAIAESGPVNSPIALPIARAEAAKIGTRVAERLKAPAENALPFLRALPADELIKAWQNGITSFVVDGWVLTGAPGEAFAEGKEHGVPLLLGSNAIEFPAGGSPTEARKMIQDTFGSLAPRALALYGLADGGSGPTVDPLYGDLNEQWGSDLFRCPVIVTGEWHSRAGNPTWKYEFCRAIRPRPKVGHSGELPYVFGNLPSSGGLGGDYQEADHKLSATIQGYWMNFAKTGDPNGPGLPAWPGYDATSKRFLRFTTSADVKVGENERGPFTDLFRELLSHRSDP